LKFRSDIQHCQRNSVWDHTFCSSGLRCDSFQEACQHGRETYCSIIAENVLPYELLLDS
jgi:hypothetical protein